MIPSKDQIRKLWDKHHLPEVKRRHCGLVARVAVFLAKQLKNKDLNLNINIPLLAAGALLHDIDKNVQRRPGEQHPDTAVRVLQQEGMGEVADLVRTHPLHSILDPTISPKSWEEKILYLADKMVKQDIFTVDKRFALWRAEDLLPEAQQLIENSYPKVKLLEKEIFDLVAIHPSEVAKLA